MMGSEVWLWAGLALVLIVVEVFTGTLFLLFFGVAAGVVAAAKAMGLSNLPLELLLFAAVGLVTTLTLRNSLRKSFGKGSEYRADDKLTLTTSIAPGATATISYQGSTWTAVNEASQELKSGQTVRITRTEGNRLFLSTL